MEEEKQGWDKIAEQESRRRRIGKAKKVGGGFAFGMEVVFAIFFLGLLILGAIIWLS